MNERDYDNAQDEIGHLRSLLREANARIESFELIWHAAVAAKFDNSITSQATLSQKTCPCCDQPWPETMTEEQRESARGTWEAAVRLGLQLFLKSKQEGEGAALTKDLPAEASDD